MLTADQMREISDRVLIGSHTLTHPVLTDLSEEVAMEELCGSQQALGQILGKEVTLFSFPYGAFNPELIRWCWKAGYERVFTTLPLLSLVQPDEFITGRVPVEPTDWRLEFRLKIAGAYRWLPRAYSFKRTFLSLFRLGPVNKLGMNDQRS